MHQVFWAFVLICVILVLALATTIMFGRIRTGAAILMIPYLGWLCFAGWLCFQIDQLNPNAETLVPAQSAPQMSI
jgi:tryptophan-rich sensory protein